MKMRSEFEKLSNIKCFINIFEFDESYNEYKYKIGKNIGDHTLGFINGAYYAFQEQQKKLDAIKKICDSYWLDDDKDYNIYIQDIGELLK